MSAIPAIEAHGLVVRYGAFTAVDGLSIVLPPGTVLGLVGPNGAGKTTTMHALAGILRPDAGRVSIGGIDLAAEPVLAKRRLAFIPDTPQLFEHLTVRQHLEFCARVYRVERGPELARELLVEHELLDKADRLPHELSRGMKQKLAICCGLLHAPAALMFDEPLTGLDPKGIRRLKDQIRQLARGGAGVLVSSHLLELVRELCDELLVVQRGKAVMQGSLDALRAQFPGLPIEATLEDVFLRATEGARP